MQQELFVYNSLSRRKERFVPLHAPHVGMYVCGPTVYGDAHLGHARPAITFDVLYRYLTHIGYSVRYVRNITDVGHLTDDSDDGEDKIAKKARLEKREPMEVAQYYTRRFNAAMARLQVLPPTIEPLASGHILEQQALIQQIIARGYAYESEGSVYFDIEAYNRDYHYGTLSGRDLDNTLDVSRALDGGGEKRHPADFALWKKASPEHIMRWQSPWSDGFPGWHCECTAMGRKYLGDTFDIHGGGIDLLFPHHDCEIAQAQAAMGHPAVRYWLHNNMITIDGKKMGKAYNNFITLDEFFTGQHPLLSRAFSPLTIRFFILSAHYRGTLDFSSPALEAAERGLQRLGQGMKALAKLTAAGTSTEEVATFVSTFPARLYAAMNDDLQTPVVISLLFDACHLINTVAAGKGAISADDLSSLRSTMHTFVVDLLALTGDDGGNKAREAAFATAVDLLLAQRQAAKAAKNWVLADSIRDQLTAAGFTIKDTPSGTQWEL